MRATKLKSIEKSKEGEVEEVYFDITIIVDKENNALLVDNSQIDYKDFVDCNTLVVKQVKIDM